MAEILILPAQRGGSERHAFQGPSVLVLNRTIALNTFHQFLPLVLFPCILYRRLLTYGPPCLLLEVDGRCVVVEDDVCRFDDEIVPPLMCADGADGAG